MCTKVYLLAYLLTYLHEWQATLDGEKSAQKSATADVVTTEQVNAAKTPAGEQSQTADGVNSKAPTESQSKTQHEKSQQTDQKESTELISGSEKRDDSPEIAEKEEITHKSDPQVDRAAE